MSTVLKTESSEHRLETLQTDRYIHTKESDPPGPKWPKDATIDSQQPNTNFGSNPELQATLRQ